MALFIYFKNLLEMCLFVCVIIGLVLAGGRWFLQNYFNDLTSQLVAVANQKNDINQRVKTINSTINKLESAQKEYVSWTPILSQVGSAVPSTITLESMVLDKQLLVFTFTGVAKTRADLLSFQESLRALPFVSRVDLPLSQLTEKENIPFIISAAIKAEEI